MRDLDAREALEVELGKPFMQRGQAHEIIVEAPCRMQSRDDVQSREVRILHGILDDGDGVVRRHRISALVLGIASEGAELAVRAADIREIHMAVHIVIDEVAAFLAPHMVGERTEPSDVLAVKEAQAVLARQALVRQHLLFDIFIALGSEQIRHFFLEIMSSWQPRRREEAAGKTFLTHRRSRSGRPCQSADAA